MHGLYVWFVCILTYLLYNKVRFHYIASKLPYATGEEEQSQRTSYHQQHYTMLPSSVAPCPSCEVVVVVVVVAVAVAVVVVVVVVVVAAAAAAFLLFYAVELLSSDEFAVVLDVYEYIPVYLALAECLKDTLTSYIHT